MQTIAITTQTRTRRLSVVEHRLSSDVKVCRGGDMHWRDRKRRSGQRRRRQQIK